MVAVRHGLAGLVVVLISLWALVGLLTKVDDKGAIQRSENMQAPLKATGYNMTVWRTNRSFIGRSITATLEQQIDTRCCVKVARIKVNAISINVARSSILPTACGTSLRWI